jgi:hypothetical protein
VALIGLALSLDFAQSHCEVLRVAELLPGSLLPSLLAIELVEARIPDRVVDH